MSNAVPNGWEAHDLGDLARKIEGGGTPSRDVPEYWDGGIPWATVKDLKKVELKSTQEFISEHGLNCSSSKLIPANTIILACRMAVGKAVYFDKDVAINQDLKAFHTAENVDWRFLLQWYLSKADHVEAMGTGSTVKGIRLDDLKILPIDLPPLPEQQKIATILSSVDDVIEKTQAQIDKLKDLKTGMMQELLTKGIGHTEFKDSPVGRIPAGWDASMLGDVCQFTQGVQISSGDMIRDNRQGYMRYMYIRDFTSDNRLWYVKDEYPHKIITDSDIAMANTGHSSGTVYKGKYGILSNNAFKISFSNKVLNTDYLFYFLQSDFFVRKIQQLFNTAGQPHVGHGNIARMPIPIPPIEEQKIIANAISKVSNTEGKNERKSSQLSKLKKALMQDLLTGKVRVKAD